MSLDALHIHSDSARLYQQEFVKYKATHSEDLVNLLDVEEESIKEWLNRSNKKVLGTKDALLSSSKQNIASLKRENYLLDSISNLTLAFERNSTEQARKQFKQEQTKRRDDSLSSVKQKASNARIIKLTKGKNTFISIAFLLVVLGAVISFGIRNKINNANIIKKEAEFNRVNELARNKVHNIQNDYSEIGNYLAEGRFDELKEYNLKYESFLAVFLENWKTEVITLEDELVATKRYFAVKKSLRSSLKFHLDSQIDQPDNVIFIQSVFDTLLDNSVRHGFKNKKGVLEFSISIQRRDTLLHCNIIDNVTPPEDDADYLADINSGINILKSRIVNFYMMSNIKPHHEFFQIKSLPDRLGTIVKIQIPYAEV